MGAHMRGVAARLQMKSGAEKDSMEFLKEVFGSGAMTYEQLAEKLNGSKDIKLANLASGQYVDKGKLDAKIAELTAANQTIKDLQNTVEKFDGVDVDGLKSSLASLQEKYDADVTAAKLDGALNLALMEAKVKNPKLAKGALDLSALKLDGEKLLGLEDQIGKLKESDPYLFDGAEKPAARVDSGHGHGAPLDEEGLDKFAAAAMKGAGLKTE